MENVSVLSKFYSKTSYLTRMAYAVLFNVPPPQHFTTWKWRETGWVRSQMLSELLPRAAALLPLPWHASREKLQKINFPMEELISYQNLTLANFLTLKPSRKGNLEGCPCSLPHKASGVPFWARRTRGKWRKCWMWLFLLYQDQTY